MPHRAPRPCSTPACAELAASDGRCVAHARETRARVDAQRPSRTERGYDSRWAKARKGFLAKHTLCSSCRAPATVVDHIRPHRGDWSLFWDRSNWQPLCASCHSRKTAEQDGRWGSFALPRRLFVELRESSLLSSDELRLLHELRKLPE